MTINELIESLKNFDVDLEIKFATRNEDPIQSDLSFLQHIFPGDGSEATVFLVAPTMTTPERLAEWAEQEICDGLYSIDTEEI